MQLYIKYVHLGWGFVMTLYTSSGNVFSGDIKTNDNWHRASFECEPPLLYNIT